MKNQSEIIIRLANKEDLDGLVLLFDNYRIFYEKESDKINAKKFLAQRLNKNDSVIYVAADLENNLLGFVQLYPIFSSTQMKKLWLLNDLYILENFRGLGFSKILIEAAKTLCKETKACGLILETSKSNTIGNRLYPKMDFVLDTEHNFYSWEV